MDGLIKGLLDVALNAIGNDDGDRRSGSQNQDERSRSTWAQVSTPSFSPTLISSLPADSFDIAQVVSGEEDKGEEENGGRRPGHHPNQWNREVWIFGVFVWTFVFEMPMLS